MTPPGWVTELLALHRPPWQERLPRRLRIAAEWQFGTYVLAALVALTQGEYPAAPLLLAGSLVWFSFLTGWREEYRINNPIAWWATVVFVSALPAFAIIVFLVDPPN